jgi:hypothetical protein
MPSAKSDPNAQPDAQRARNVASRPEPLLNAVQRHAGVEPATSRLAAQIVEVQVDCLERRLQAGDRLIACKLCLTPFVAFRKQQFCTERCAQKFRNDKKASRREIVRR